MSTAHPAGPVRISPESAARAATPSGAIGAPSGPPLAIEVAPPWLRVHLTTPHRTLGWTIVGGGWQITASVSWIEVGSADLAPPADARAFVSARLADVGRSPDEPVLMTGCAIADHVVARAFAGDASATCIATVGLGNALRVGDPPTAAAQAGTINLLCVTSSPLSEAAQIEALAIAAEARTAAVLESGVASPLSARPATGTGTDCTVIATPLGSGLAYAGKHTAMGAVIGAAVLDAVAQGVAAWCARHGSAAR